MAKNSFDVYHRKIFPLNSQTTDYACKLAKNPYCLRRYSLISQAIKAINFAVRIIPSSPFFIKTAFYLPR
ncbi:hypothetical protein [Sodalis praecaptivus]|uniref:hypothetical protein n=1 Tax=Sodalis TaxID=84565 RepID=UPI0011DD5085|nr:hypothetical protein [Sodalis praecaptivus]